MTKLLFFSIGDQRKYLKFTRLIRMLARSTVQNYCRLTLQRDCIALRLRESDETDCKMLAIVSQFFFTKYKFTGGEDAHDFLLCELNELAGFLELYKKVSCELIVRVGEGPPLYGTLNFSELTPAEAQTIVFDAIVRLPIGRFTFSTLLTRARIASAYPQAYAERTKAKRLSLVHLSAQQCRLADILKGPDISMSFRPDCLFYHSVSDSRSIVRIDESLFRFYEPQLIARVLTRGERVVLSQHLLQSLMFFLRKGGSMFLPMLIDKEVRDQTLKVAFLMELDEMWVVARRRCPLTSEHRSQAAEAERPPAPSLLCAKPLLKVNTGPQLRRDLDSAAAQAPKELPSLFFKSSPPKEAAAAARRAVPPITPAQPSPGSLLGPGLTDLFKPSEKSIAASGRTLTVKEQLLRVQEANASKIQEARLFFSERHTNL